MKRNTETVKETQATQIGYGEAQINWAKTMLLNGIAPADVARQTGINPGYARTLKFRLSSKENEVLAKPAREHDSEVLREFVALNTVTETVTPVSIVPEKKETWRFGITRLDVVFYATTLTTCAGLVTLLRCWGLPVSLVYSMILFDAMQTAKDPDLKESAQAGAIAVLFFEAIAACVHIYFFNFLIWANHKTLPFRIGDKFIDSSAKWVVENEDKPFLIAVGIALVLSGSAVYAIHKSIVTAKERAKITAK